MFGAPSGALTSFGKSLTESSTVRPMCPLKGCSGRGNTSCVRAGSAKNELIAVLTLVSNILRLFTFASLRTSSPRRKALSRAPRNQSVPENGGEGSQRLPSHFRMPQNSKIRRAPMSLKEEPFSEALADAPASFGSARKRFSKLILDNRLSKPRDSAEFRGTSAPPPMSATGRKLAPCAQKQPFARSIKNQRKYLTFQKYPL